MPETVVMLLSPLGMGSGGVPGAMQVTADCGHQCWISPSGVQTMLSMGAKSRCMDCTDPGELAKGTFLPPTPDTRAELVSVLGEREAEDTIAKGTNPATAAAMVDFIRSRRRG